MQQHGRNTVAARLKLYRLVNIYRTIHWKLIDRLLTLVCIILKVNLGVGEMCFMFYDL